MSLTAAAKKIRQKRASRPIYMIVRRLLDPVTRQEVGALVPENQVDSELMRARGYRVGQELRAELKAPRDGWRHRLLHKIGALMVENVDGWEALDTHEAVKRLQREAGVCCEQVDMEATAVVSAVLAAADAAFGPGAAKLLREVLPRIETIPVTVARSLAFDCMDEDEFRRLFEGITAHIGTHYTHVMLDEVVAEFWLMANGQGTQSAPARRAA
ncbi:hypothetical protein [Xanthomonas translucens]|uniref:hypothetical protein n=1 Tax=Xanthomonas campestris pv. translucens TaxID=343 RepID=UPI00071B55D1|nr:hypothetical protein [Xanthomonas translucens]AVY67186.1 hypothetical protein NZ30_12900 [Xanthomonas translucens pv. undulosa]MCT8281780.1 hypothetical protein [Xanthomonas translucens pv. undulosa]MCT8316466.1 hypothetical protein [Xanthomonas translucens pv. undulosa]UKE38294.1 hypothetical protein KCU58_11000 [Xanthomonas translucens pv. undulosa]